MNHIEYSSILVCLMQTQDCYRSCHRNAPEGTRCCVNSGSFCKVLCPIFVSFSLKLWLSRLPVFTHPYSYKCPQAFLKDTHLSLLTFRVISEALPNPRFSFPSQLVITPRFLYPQSSNILLQVEGLHCCFHPSFSISEKCPLHATKRRTKQLCLKQELIFLTLTVRQSVLMAPDQLSSHAIRVLGFSGISHFTVLCADYHITGLSPNSWKDAHCSSRHQVQVACTSIFPR